MKTSISDSLISLCPKSLRLPLMFYYYGWSGRLEDELLYLEKLIQQKKLVNHGKRAIDIGANYGFYSYLLSRFFSVVEAFEPESGCFEMVNAYSQDKSGINVHNVALSNFEGSLDLHTPIVQGKRFTGLSSFSKHEEECTSTTVPVKRLDEYKFDNVSLIKIDVEGYESEVIEGGRETILREKPNILVEIEQRHLRGKQIESVFEQIISLGYQGNFLYQETLVPLSDFVYEKHQKPFEDDINRHKYDNLKSYVNNFLFQPQS